MPLLPWRWWQLRQLAWWLCHSQAAEGKGSPPQYRCPCRQPHPFHTCTLCCRLSPASLRALPRTPSCVCFSFHPLPAPGVLSFFSFIFFFFHLKVLATPGAFIFDDVVVVRWSTCSSQSAVDLNAGESQQWAERRVSGINLIFKQPGCIPDFRDTSLCWRLGLFFFFFF